ncbi:MAG: hypothetical protein M3022_04220 [Actinomycetota bacterium]|nr:hypothetical protein [Actinomycetota bacterium]
MRRVRGAWQGRAIASRVRGATPVLRYRIQGARRDAGAVLSGGPLALIGETGARGGVARTLEGVAIAGRPS